MNALTPIELSFGFLALSRCADIEQATRHDRRSARGESRLSGHVKYDA